VDPVEASGPTVEEAIDRALELLGASEDEAEIRVVSEGGPGEEARVTAKLRHEVDDPDGEEATPVSPEELERQADLVEDFLNGLLDQMDVDADVDVSVEPDHVYAELSGEDAGLLIGRHGATIEAFQEITRSAVKAATGSWPAVSVDVEGYLDRRREQLSSRALRLADKVRRSGQPVDMPPMTSSERKIVHQALSRVSGVRTESTGQGPDRHLTIFPA
jgi:spoIIIJ-associated protein